MSNFSTILKNLVGSGMNNTESALIVLESFFEKTDTTLSNAAIQHRSNIADIKNQLSTSLITEQDAQFEFAKIKKHTLDLINKVDATPFEDAVILNYFSMLDPNPAKDPFFSPIAVVEQPVVKQLTKTPITTVDTTQTSPSDGDSKSFGLILAVIVLLFLGLIFFFRTSPTVVAPQSIENTPSKQSDVKAQSIPVVTSQPAETGKTTTTTTAKPNPSPVVKPIPDKPKIPDVKPKPVAKREQIERYVDSLNAANQSLKSKTVDSLGIVKQALALKKVDLKKSNARLIEWGKLKTLTPEQQASKEEEEKKFAILDKEVRRLNNEEKRLTAAIAQ